MDIGEEFTGIYEDRINGRKVLIAFKNGKKDGVTKYFHENCQIALEIEYHDDMINGEMRVYDEFGSILMNAFYTNGALNGDMTTYYSNGMKQCASRYKAGYRDGTLITYDTFGDISTTSMWKNGKRNGTEQVYYPKSLGGNIYSMTEYVDGQRHGKQIQYARDGKVLTITTYKYDRAQEYPRKVYGNDV